MKKRSERKKLCIRICLTVIAVVTALIFIMPIVLTISNSFMSAAEITSNYGSIFQKTDTGGKQYISQTVNLKFIPDMVTFSQYATVLFKSPDYLLKFWYSSWWWQCSPHMASQGPEENFPQSSFLHM